MLAEILEEPACPHNTPIHTRIAYRFFAAQRALLAASRQQNELLDPAANRQLDKSLHRIRGSRKGEIRIIAHINRRNAFYRRLPCRGILPIERRHTGPRTNADTHPSSGKPLSDSPARFSSASKNQRLFVVVHVFYSSSPRLRDRALGVGASRR